MYVWILWPNFFFQIVKTKNNRGDVTDILAKKKQLAPVKWKAVAPHKQRGRPQVVLKRLCLKSDCTIADTM